MTPRCARPTRRWPRPSSTPARSSPRSAPAAPTRRCSPRSPPSTTASRRRCSSSPASRCPSRALVVISPYDASAKGAIEKAIRESDLGVNPTDDGKVLRVALPELTEERRKEYIKLAKTKAEDGRVAVRSVRRTAKQALDKAEKDSEISKDDNTGAEKRLDGLTKKHVDTIDELLKNKEAELLEV